MLNAGQLDLRASNIANTNGGEIVQTGTGATTIATSGAIDNSQGRIATNGQDLSLSAASFTNTAGTIEHAGSGTLRIAGGSYSGASGQITGNGALAVNVAGDFNQDGGSTHAKQITIDAGALSNQGGKIVQAGADATRITVVGALEQQRRHHRQQRPHQHRRGQPEQPGRHDPRGRDRRTSASPSAACWTTAARARSAPAATPPSQPAA